MSANRKDGDEDRWSEADRSDPWRTVVGVHRDEVSPPGTFSSTTVADTAHDLDNLLTIIAWSAEMLLAAMPTDDPSRRHALRIIESTNRAARAVQQLLPSLPRRQR